MTSWMPWDIYTSDGDNPLKVPAEFEFNLEFEYDPGEPEFGEYGEYNSGQPSVRVIGAACKTIKVVDSNMRVPTAYELDMLEDWFMSKINDDENLRRQISEYGIDQMCVEPYSDDVDD